MRNVDVLRSPTILTLAPAALLFTASASCSVSTASSREVDPHDGFGGIARLLVEPGTQDVNNVFLPAVRIYIEIPDLPGQISPRNCSGTLVHPRVVVTAGHCVCLPRIPDPEEEVRLRKSRKSARRGVLTRAQMLRGASITGIIDKRSPCAQVSLVTAFVYPKPGEAPRPPTQRPGRVLIHPEIELIEAAKKGRTGLFWNNADLAVIVFDDPMPSNFKPVLLSDSEAKVGDPLVMAGYAQRDPNEKSTLRRFGDNEVTRRIPLETGNMLFSAAAPPGPKYGAPAHAEHGDSGGACVRKDDPNVLMGIITMEVETDTGAKASCFTSLFPHRRWLLEVMQRVDDAADAGVRVPGPDSGVNVLGTDAGRAPPPPPGTP